MQEGPFCKKKGGAVCRWHTIKAPFSPAGSVGAICMPPACRTGAVAENPCLAPDEAFLRSPEGGIETTESGRAEKRPSKKAAELQEANGGDWGRLGADRDRGIEIDTDRNTDRERDIDRGRKHRNHW